MPIEIGISTTIGGIAGNTPGGDTPPFSNVNSFLYDGVDEKMFSTANYTELNGSTNFSISFWIKPIGTNTNGVWEIETQGNNETLNCRYLGSQQLIIIHFRSQSYYYRSAPNSVLLNQWSHIVYTYNGALARYDRPEIYVNGALSQGVNSGVPYTSSNFNGTLTFGDATQYVYGNNYIDEFAVWNDTTLTQTQANELYNGGAPSDLNNIASGLAQPTTWFRMGEEATWNGFTWTMTDFNGSTILRGANMQESSRTTDVPPNPFANTKSIALDGVDDFVDVGYVAELNNASTFTYSGWYKQTTIDQERFLMGFFVSAGNWFALYTWSDGNMYIHFKDGGVNKYGVFDYSTLVTANAWFNIVIVFNGSNSTNADRLKCYINGAQATLSFVGTQPITTPSGANNLTLGKMDSFTQTWLGGADELALWNTDESANVSTIYNGGVPNDLTSLSPLSWWRCGDSDTSPTLTDNGSGGNDGTMTNFSTFSSDVPTFTNTKSILLDGVDDFVTMGNVLNMADDGTDSFSCSFWMKRNSFNTEMIVSKQLNSGSYNGLSIYIAQGRLNFFLGSATSPNSNITGRSTNYVIGSTWTNVIVTYDGSQDISGFNIYINGVSDSVVTISNNTPTKVSNTTDFQLSGRAGGTSLVYGGGLDEVAFWNGTELTSTQANNIGGTIPTDLSTYNPTSWWRFEGSGTTATDNGSGGNNGTLTNGVTRSTDVPTFSKKSIALDGVDDFCETASTYSELDAANKLTISFWAKSTNAVLSLPVQVGIGSNRQFYIAISNSGRITFKKNINTDNTGIRADNGTPHDGNWNHIMICMDLTATASLKGDIFFNGVNVTHSRTLDTNAIQTSTGNLYINEVNKDFTGNIDEVAIWSGTDLRNDVATIYNNGEPTDLNNNGLTAPTTWYRMGDGDTAPTIQDTNGSANLTMQNFSTFSTDVPT